MKPVNLVGRTLPQPYFDDRGLGFPTFTHHLMLAYKYPAICISWNALQGTDRIRYRTHIPLFITASLDLHCHLPAHTYSFPEDKANLTSPWESLILIFIEV